MQGDLTPLSEDGGIASALSEDGGIASALSEDGGISSSVSAGQVSNFVTIFK